MPRFAVLTFVSAFLLFLVQPLIARAVLPWFGGAASVWTTSLVFYQTLLFGGYAYAHVGRRLGVRHQAVLHMLLVGLSLLLLPVTLVVEGHPSSLTGANVAGFAYLATAGGALAYTLWFRGIERLGARNVTFLSLLSPVVATTIGVVAGDRLTVWQLAGAGAVVASIFAVQRPSRPAGTTDTVTATTPGVPALASAGTPCVAKP